MKLSRLTFNYRWDTLTGHASLVILRLVDNFGKAEARKTRDRERG